jgi:hypothetical protein
MPLQKVVLKPGVNRENTRYTNEGGWYESDKVRFRQGTPEKIGGWTRISSFTFLGVCRSLWNWVTYTTGLNLIGVGTSSKFYIENDAYYDITPIRATVTLSNPFTTDTATNTGSVTTVVVTDTLGGFANGDYVSFYGASAVGGVTVYGEYVITYITSTTYSIQVTGTASSSTTGGGNPVYAVYQVTTGATTYTPNVGWGAGAWGSGPWGIGPPIVITTGGVRIWSQTNWGEDLVFGPRGGPIYYWDASIGITPTVVTISNANPCLVTCSLGLTEGTVVSFITTGTLPTGVGTGTTTLLPGVNYYVRAIPASTTTFNISATATGALIDTSGGTQSGTHSVSPRGYALTALAGSDSSCPASQITFTVSDISRFLLVFGTNDYGSTTVDPMLVRWSNQESLTTWTPAITNQAGSVRLSHGSKIVTTLQSRQEILVWTDSTMYSFQYLGPPYVWGTQILADNVSIISPNAAVMASGVTYWMGVDKFYKYDGRTQTLRCDLRQYIYSDINLDQVDQVFGSTNEGFNEVWWFYCSEASVVVDRYVIYNYFEDIWYYGTMGRTAWLDSGLRNYPIAATYSNNIVEHENGVDDGITLPATAISASITSAQYDIGDGHNFAFVYRMIPDLTFRGSTAGTTPQITMYLQGLNNSGSGITQSGYSDVTYSGTVPSVINVDQFTGQVYIRVRGRQMQMQITSNTLGTQWQLGSPRIDIRPDGRR